MMIKSGDKASDIAQDAFFDMWKNRHRMADIENFGGYMHNCVRFLILKRLRRFKVEEAYAHYLKHRMANADAVPQQEQQLAAKQMQQHIENGIRQLPPQQQRAFRLSREQGLTHEQICDIMGVSKKTVKDYIVRAIAFLKPLLNQHYGGISWAILLLALG